MNKIIEKYAPVNNPILFKVVKLKLDKYCILVDKGIFWKDRYVILENVHLANFKDYWNFENECTSNDLIDVTNKHKFLIESYQKK